LNQKVVDENEQSTTALSKRIEALSERLSAIEDKLVDATEQVESKSAGDMDGGNNSVLKLREAIKRLKEDVVGMSLTSSFLAHSILAKKIEGRRRVCAAEQRKQKQRRKGASKRNRFGGGKKQEGAVGDGSSDEDDDGLYYDP
jgi:hypothetical protein